MVQRLLDKKQSQAFSRLAHLIGWLSTPARLKIIEVLAEGPREVQGIAKKSRLSIANTSQHLQLMADDHFVEVERSGLLRIYRLSPQITKILKRFLDLSSELHRAQRTAAHKRR